MIQLQRQLSIRLDLPGISFEQVEAFLVQPKRPLRALLSRSRLEVIGSVPGRFDYASKPFGVGQWQLQPRVQLHAAWQESALRIRCLDCRIEGLGGWQSAVTYRFEAELRPGAEACYAKVISELNLEPRGALALLPSSLLQKLGEQALEQALARMERRCRTGLQQQLQSLRCPNPIGSQ